MTSKPRVLLTSVFQPFGVDDAFGRKSNLIELFHNQISREQGIASPRAFFRSYGLYFLAENIDAPTTVLDFPTLEQFVAELRSTAYDVIGISFIVPTLAKAREMARLAREIRPQARILLGGHGAAVENVAELVPCDEVVRGEGIGPLRRLLGEAENRPLRHPCLPAEDYYQVFGLTARNYPRGGRGSNVAGLLVPGVGCVNGCRFCAPTHFFDKTYIPFLKSAEEIFETLVRIHKELGAWEFRVMDENFLKEPERAMRLIELLERNRMPFQFAIFSSAETIESFGVKNMVRLGVNSVWIGVESKMAAFEKNKGRDLKAIIAELRRHGMGVIASSIVCLEDHTPENLSDDVDYAIGMNADFTQFMLLTAYPGTGVYQNQKEKGKVDFTLPYEDWHGQEWINFHHPHFTREEAKTALREAFQKEYAVNSSSMTRLLTTVIRGVETLTGLAQDDEWIGVRRDEMRKRATMMRPLLPVLQRFAHNETERERVRGLMVDYDRWLGATPLGVRLLGWVAVRIALFYAWKVKIFGDTKQPKTLKTRYRWA